uniref:Protein kinase domain-containing protein n=1 Tax=Romanomermis culicivorax TaxID=13658 RepID=A0A915L8J4_ROMCU
MNTKPSSISGGQLLDRVTSSDSVPETQIAFFIRQLLQALEHMHNKNIVHLDLRPENIMLSEKGTDQIKLSDFGLSRRLRRDKSTFGTMGSPEFVAPEIVQQRPVSLSTDMWSVGVLAYVM